MKRSVEPLCVPLRLIVVLVMVNLLSSLHGPC